MNKIEADVEVYYKNIGKQMHIFRMSHPWTIDDFSSQLKIKPALLGAYERGEKKIPMDILIKISDTYQVPIVTFFKE